MKCGVTITKKEKCKQNAEFIVQQVGFKPKIPLCMHHFTELQKKVFISPQHMTQHTGRLIGSDRELAYE